MSTEFFSNEFDVKLASYINRNTFGHVDNVSFDEYEKSVFLSQAQRELVIELYSGRNNKGISFESNEESRRILHNLTRQKTIEVSDTPKNIWTIDKSEIPDLLFITYETVSLLNPKEPEGDKIIALVVPVKQDTLSKVLNNPFTKPNYNKVIRTDRFNSIQLISEYDMYSYTVDYIKKPNPIILTDLEDLEIDGKSSPQEFELDIIKDDILNRAVQLALISRNININNNN